MDTTTATAPTTQYAVLVSGVAHVIAEGPIDHYGRWADPRGLVPYAYTAACGWGTAEEGMLLLSRDELTTDRPCADDWDLCAGCFPAGF